jgi:hypothetical protein
VCGVAAASRNTRFQAARYGLTWVGLTPTDLASFAWRLPSFDHLVGEQCQWHVEAESLRGFNIDCEGVTARRLVVGQFALRALDLYENRADAREALMTKALGALMAAATLASATSAVPTTADARCVGCAVGVSERPADAPPGYVYYPAYGEPLPGSNCNWFRTPVYDAYGKMFGWRGRPVAFCSWLSGFRPWPLP